MLATPVLSREVSMPANVPPSVLGIGMVEQMQNHVSVNMARWMAAWNGRAEGLVRARRCPAPEKAARRQPG
jgi:hypothetical protein